MAGSDHPARAQNRPSGEDDEGSGGLRPAALAERKSEDDGDGRGCGCVTMTEKAAAAARVCGTSSDDLQERDPGYGEDETLPG
ncbi:hypothetical protein L1987_42842 [Smallanthus sonchifolius]|uniref:Uncharacterized protein n=1 Tax=Smallanthus sonchifolius TaxID=185202 RepID=A0ACB9GKN1_9ASTR|nr:hypothetical protein L1987_42842 [Smallanthus sonchifolius]